MMDIRGFMVFFVGLAGCTLDPPRPFLQAVAPDWAVDDESTPIEITGQNLLPRLAVSATDPDARPVDGAYEVWLDPVLGGDPTELPSARLARVGAIDVVVPEGLPLGDYDVRVVTPFGQSATLASAFHVVDTRADALKIDLDAASWEAGAEGRLTVQVLDVSGAPIAAEMGVRISIVGDTVADPGVTFEPLILEDQVNEADGISGRLGADGRAEVRLVVARPDRYTVRVQATDGGVIASDDARVEVYPGQVVAVRAELPSANFTATAGVPFPVVLSLVDANGFVVEGASRTLALVDTCGAFGVVRSVTGSTTIELTATRATGTPSCPTDQILISGALDVEGRTEPFAVIAGPAAALSVAASGPSPTPGAPSVVAGATLGVVVSPVDAYGNAAPSAASIVEVTDSAGGVASFECGASLPRYCSVTVVKATAQDALLVRDSDGLVGTSNTFGVEPGPPTSGALGSPSATWRAGEPVPVSLSVVDAWGNLVDAALLTPGAVTSDDLLGDVVCGEITGVGPWEMLCEATTATPGNALTVALPAYDLVLTSPAFAVVNGPLGRLRVDASVQTTVAGVAFGVVVVATDAWGNPYVVQDDPWLHLPDGSGPVFPDDVRMAADGTAAFDAVLTRRGLTSLRVVSGVVEGQSSPIAVLAADAHHLAVTVGRRWAWVGEPAAVTVESVDIYGNRTEDRLFASLTSEDGIGPVVNFLISNGTASPSFQWSASSASERLLAAADGGLLGASEPVAVVRECGLLGPRAILRFNNAVTGVYCGAGPSDPVTISASMAGSAAGLGGSISSYGLAIENGPGQLAAVAAQSVEVVGYGRFDVSGVVVQQDGCGAGVTGQVYVGPDDGTVVGPVTVRLDPPVVDILGASPFATVTIDRAETCRGTPASNVDVFVRADRGALSGAFASTSGLVAALDNNGSAVLDFDASAATGPGVATIEVNVLSEAAIGQGTTTLTGDPTPPQVWWQEPKGPIDQDYDDVVLRFSEQMDASIFTPASFDLVGGVARRVLAVDPALGGSAAILHLDAPLSPGNAWLLTARGDLRDPAGNALAGAWGLPGVSYTGLIGTSGVVDPINSCSVDRAIFRPDGDDGPGQEADTVGFFFSSATAPAWWVVEVTDPDGAPATVAHLAPNGPLDGWTWDGRDASGRVARAGAWTLSVSAEGSFGGRSVACSRQVELVQRGVR